jgi:Integrase core domain
MQFDWTEFTYEQDGVKRKRYGFAAILCYSRMRFVAFVKRCDTPTLLRCIIEACKYFGVLPKAALTDRMKSALLAMDGEVPRWNLVFSDFMASIGVAPRVCKAYTPQTKGKIERTASFVKQSLWTGIYFSDIDNVNQQSHSWYERINARVHRNIPEHPLDRKAREPLSPLPAAFAWELFTTEERKVSWDGYLSYDGVLYGLPSEPPLARTVVQVREQRGVLSVWSRGQSIMSLVKRPHSQDIVECPDQFRTVATANASRRAVVPWDISKLLHKWSSVSIALAVKALADERSS